MSGLAGGRTVGLGGVVGHRVAGEGCRTVAGQVADPGSGDVCWRGVAHRYRFLRPPPPTPESVSPNCRTPTPRRPPGPCRRRLPRRRLTPVPMPRPGPRRRSGSAWARLPLLVVASSGGVVSRGVPVTSSDGGPSPTSLTAMTLTAYSTPSVSPAMVWGVRLTVASKTSAGVSQLSAGPLPLHLVAGDGRAAVAGWGFPGHVQRAGVVRGDVQALRSIRHRCFGCNRRRRLAGQRLLVIVVVVEGQPEL